MISFCFLLEEIQMATATSQNPAITLEFVKSKFDEWRATRKHKSKTPPELWEYAKQLYPHYTCGKISATLNLSHAELKSKLVPSVSSVPSKETSFAEYLIPSSFLEDKKESTLEFIRKDGLILKLKNFSTQNLLPVVSLFLTVKP